MKLPFISTYSRIMTKFDMWILSKVVGSFQILRTVVPTTKHSLRKDINRLLHLTNLPFSQAFRRKIQQNVTKQVRQFLFRNTIEAINTFRRIPRIGFPLIDIVYI